MCVAFCVSFVCCCCFFFVVFFLGGGWICRDFRVFSIIVYAGFGWFFMLTLKKHFFFFFFLIVLFEELFWLCMCLWVVFFFFFFFLNLTILLTYFMLYVFCVDFSVWEGGIWSIYLICWDVGGGFSHIVHAGFNFCCFFIYFLFNT